MGFWPKPFFITLCCSDVVIYGFVCICAVYEINKMTIKNTGLENVHHYKNVFSTVLQHFGGGVLGAYSFQNIETCNA